MTAADSSLSAYNLGRMGCYTPSIDRVPKGHNLLLLFKGEVNENSSKRLARLERRKRRISGNQFQNKPRLATGLPNSICDPSGQTGNRTDPELVVHCASRYKVAGSGCVALPSHHFLHWQPTVPGGRTLPFSMAKTDCSLQV